MKLLDNLKERWKTLPKWLQFVLLIAALGLTWLVSELISTGNYQGSGADLTSSTVSLGISTFFKLLVVLILIYVIAISFMQWRGNPFARKTQRMAVVETLQLTPKRALHLVKIGEQILLVGATDHGITLLRSFNPDELPEEEMAAVATGMSFSGILHNQIQQDHRDQT
ncbi:MAG TPA: flagellar biosynthetic protein FliO [Anaerolineaceae bacterium]